MKDQIEALRRSRPSSGLDFEKVFQANEMLEQEKELFEKLTSGIAEIEEKISELEG